MVIDFSTLRRQTGCWREAVSPGTFQPDGRWGTHPVPTRNHRACIDGYRENVTNYPSPIMFPDAKFANVLSAIRPDREPAIDLTLGRWPVLVAKARPTRITLHATAHPRACVGPDGTRGCSKTRGVRTVEVL